jgi:hypothetical protein
MARNGAKYSTMDTRSAFGLLGLPLTASPEEIEDRFRELARERHPDVGGSGDAMGDLNSARDVALASLTTTTAVVPSSFLRDLVVASERNTVRQEHKERAHGLTRRITQVATSRLRSMRNQVAVLAGVSAAGLFLGKEIPAEVFGAISLSPRATGLLTLMAIVFGVTGACLSWFMQERIRRIEQDVQDLEHHLGFRSGYVDFLTEVWPFVDHGRWTVVDLERGIDSWSRELIEPYRKWRGVAHAVGPADFARLLIAKGQELGLLERKEDSDGRRLSESYSLQIGPPSS